MHFDVPRSMVFPGGCNTRTKAGDLRVLQREWWEKLAGLIAHGRKWKQEEGR